MQREKKQRENYKNKEIVSCRGKTLLEDASCILRSCILSFAMSFHKIYTAIITLPIGIVFCTDIITLHRVNDEKLTWVLYCITFYSWHVMYSYRKFKVGDVLLGVQRLPLKQGDTALIR